MCDNRPYLLLLCATIPVIGDNTTPLALSRRSIHGGVRRQKDEFIPITPLAATYLMRSIYPRRSYWMPGSYASVLSEKRDSFLSLWKNKGFKEERMAKVGLDAIGTSTTLESHKSLESLHLLSKQPLQALTMREPALRASLFMLRIDPRVLPLWVRNQECWHAVGRGLRVAGIFVLMPAVLGMHITMPATLSLKVSVPPRHPDALCPLPANSAHGP